MTMSRSVLLINRASGGNERGLIASQVCDVVHQAFVDDGHQMTALVIDPWKIEDEIKDAMAGQPDGLIALSNIAAKLFR